MQRKCDVLIKIFTNIPWKQFMDEERNKGWKHTFGQAEVGHQEVLPQFQAFQDPRSPLLFLLKKNNIKLGLSWPRTSSFFMTVFGILALH